MDTRFLQVHQNEEIKKCTHSVFMKPKDIYHFKTRGQLMRSTSWATSLSAFTLKKITKTHCKAKELAVPGVREEKQGLEIHIRSRSSSLHHPIKRPEVTFWRNHPKSSWFQPHPRFIQKARRPFSELTQRKDPHDADTWGSPVRMPAYCPTVKLDNLKSTSDHLWCSTLKHIDKPRNIWSLRK